MADNPYPDPNTSTQPKQNAASGYQWDPNNVFKSWDLNPLANEVGAGADGVRDTLSASRDAYLQPLMQSYRQQVGVGGGGAAADDQSLFGDANFQNYVRTGQAPQSAISSWTGSSTTTAAPTQTQNDLIAQMFARQKAQEDEGQARGTNLYNTLLSRAQQGTAIDRNDPNIRQQSDAFNANATRASRDYMADLAEKSGPTANLRGEQRLNAERLGQATGSFESQLIGHELESRRTEIQNALSQMGQFLSVDQQNALQKQLAILDSSIKQQSVGNDTLRTLLQNQQFNSGLNSQNDQFAAQLGFNAADRAAYWDSVRNGQSS